MMNLQRLASKFPAIRVLFHLGWDRAVTHAVGENYVTWLTGQTVFVLISETCIHSLDLKATESVHCVFVFVIAVE